MAWSQRFPSTTPCLDSHVTSLKPDTSLIVASLRPTNLPLCWELMVYQSFFFCVSLLFERECCCSRRSIKIPSTVSGAFIFAGILYAWQFPHFYALAWRRRGDYARGSYHMLPLSHPDATRYVVMGHVAALWALCFAAPLTNVATFSFVTMAVPANALLTYHSFKFFRWALFRFVCKSNK